MNGFRHVWFVGAMTALLLFGAVGPALAQRGPTRGGGDANKDAPKDTAPPAGGATPPAGAPAGTPPAGGAAPTAASTENDSYFNCKKARGQFAVNLKPDVELADLVTWAMGFTCRNFVYSSGIGGRTAKVTIMSPTQMSASEAWRVFLVALQSMNLTVVPKGSVLEIVEQPQAKREPLPIYTKGLPSARAQVVRAVLRPDHLSVEDLAAVLTELRSKDGEVKAVPKAGVIIVTDFASHISKMSSIMLSVDRPVIGERLYMIHVKHANASELAAKIQEIIGMRESPGGGGAPAPAPRRPQRPQRTPDGGTPPAEAPSTSGETIGSTSEVASALPSKLIADERTNSLILLASEAAYLRVRALVKRLDIELDVEGGGRIHVYYLENADAEEMSTTLTAVITGIQQQSSQQQGGGGGGPNQPQGRQRPTPPPQLPSGVATPGAEAFEGDVRVTHDKPTNSLVIVASVGDFLAVREVIRKLDTPRPQVYIEATIVEVAIDNSRSIGTAFHGGAEVGDGSLVIGGVKHNELSTLNLTTLLTANGLIGGILGPLLPEAEQILGTSIPSYGVLFQALATNSNVNVLSSPHILTTDNEEAEISVGENIPYQSALTNLGGLGGAGGAAGGFFPTQSIQRQDVALTLKITPQINASDMIRLAIDLEISDIASPDFQGLGPSWAKRTIKDTVVVRDQQSVVIGGLMSDRTTSSESKVPLLGDIPVLGYLFKYKTKTKKKTNLLVLLTPYVVKNQMDIEAIVERRVREQHEFVRSFSSLSTMNYRPDLDYRRKRGVVEEINRSVMRYEEEAAILRSLEERTPQYEDGQIDYFEQEEPDVPVDEQDVVPGGEPAAPPPAKKSGGAGQ